MSNKIYQYKWTGERTGWDYRLEFIPPDDALLDNPTVITLPPGSVEVSKMGMKYDKYPIGAGEAPTLDLKVYLNEVNDADFKDVAIRPGKTLTGGLAGKDIQGGLIVKLYIKFNGNSEDAVNVERLQFMGICREEAVTKLNVSEMVSELQFQDLYKIVLQSFTFDEAYYTLFPKEYDEVSTVNVIEAYAVASVDKQAWQIIHTWNDNDTYAEFHLRPISHIMSYITFCASKIIAQMLRVATYTFNLGGYIVPTCYRQLNNGSGGVDLNNPLLINSNNPTTDIYFITSINNGDVYAGLFSKEDESSVNARYKGKSIWDFLSETTESVIKKIIYYADGLDIQGAYYNFGIIELSSSNLNSATLSMSSDRVKQVKASFVESYSDENYSDLDSWEEAEVRGQNEGGYDLTCVWNNMPVCSTYTNATGGIDWLAYNTMFRTTGLYYLDTFLSSTQAVRINEYVSFTTGVQSTESLPGCVPITERWDDLENNKPSERIAKNQVVSNIGRWSSAALMAMFGSKEQSKLEIEVDYNLGVYFSTMEEAKWTWWNLNMLLQIKFDSFPFVNFLSSKTWVITSTELNFADETAKVELLTKNV